MGIFSALFGKPIDRVGPIVRSNTDQVDTFLKSSHPKSLELGDFTFEYLYTASEPINENGDFGSVIYIRIESSIHKEVSKLPFDDKQIQSAIDEHQNLHGSIPPNLLKDKTRWLYFNMSTIFRAC